MILDILYAIFIQPIEWGMGLVFTQSFDFLHSYGLAIILLSLVVNITLIPIYLISDSWQAQERVIQERMRSKLDEIKLAFAGQERFMMTRMLYKINHYHPLMAARSSIGLLIQIPFFFAAYQLISNYDALNNVSFFIFSDLSKPDGLLSIGSWHINLMPFVMTAINLASAYVYASNLSKKDKIQVYVIAGIFLIVLYSMPVALVLYWTMNNVFSLVKNILYKPKEQSIKTASKTSSGATVLLGYSIKVFSLIALILLAPISKLLAFNWDYFNLSLIEVLLSVFVLSLAVTLIFSPLYLFERLKNIAILLLSILLIASTVTSHIIPINLGAIDGGDNINFLVRSAAAYAIYAFFAIFIVVTFLIYKLKLLKLKIKKIINSLATLSVLYIAIFSIYASLSAPAGYAFTGSSNEEYRLPLSSNKNIFILSFDQVQGSLLNGLIKTHPELFSGFNGFTSYSDAASTYPNTYYSLSSVLLGRIAKNENENYNAALADKNALPAILNDSGASIYTNKYSSSPRYTCLTCGDEEKSFNWLQASELFRHAINIGFGFDLNNVFTLPKKLTGEVPPELAEHAWQIDLHKFKNLSNNMFIEHKNDSVYLMHFFGTHQPFIYESSCSLKSKESIALSQNIDGALGEATCLISLIGNFIEKLKALDLYDSSTIVVYSDHGYESNINNYLSSHDYPQYFEKTNNAFGDSRNIKPAGSYNPFLLLKPENSNDEIKINSSPVSLIDIAPTLCATVQCGENWAGKPLGEQVNTNRTRNFWLYLGGADRRTTDGRDKLHDGLDEFWEQRSFKGAIYPNLAIAAGSDPKLLTYKLNVSEPLVFSGSGNANAYTMHGWSAQEVSHRWTEGNQAGLLITLDDYKSGDLLLRLTGNAYLGGGLSHQDIAVSINGTQVANWQMVGLENYDAVIPAELIPENAELNIVFDISEPSAPCEVSDSTDCRKLGFAARELVIDYATSSSTPVSNPVQTLGAKLSINEPIQFSDIGNANTYIAQGWSAQEPTHHWTEGDQAGLLISLGDYKSGDLLLSLHGSGYLGDGLNHQNIAVSVNGAHVANWEVAGLGLYQARIPAELIPESGELNIVFDISDPKAPCDVGESTDCRKLGMSVQDILIDYVK